ncbi:MAG TPA: family 20 glycosylhydrolase [Acidimicrobiales bacterium]
MNLLPRPRHLALGEALVARRPPVARHDASLPAQGYELRIDAGAVHLVAGDEAGEFYGRATLDQLARLHEGHLPVGTVRDWPDFAVRGVMLDISRDKVPTMATLEALVDRLASWKINQVQLYFEHTFAYRGHEEVWRRASPLSAEEVRQLDGYCRARHVELVPNQNCLGHMGRWLAHERYRPLAIAPDGWPDARGHLHAPTTIDPLKPGSLALVRELLAQLLPCFTSERVQVGLDEPWELPPDRIGDYVSWVRTLRDVSELSGREMLIWGDILANHPDTLAELPEGVTVCEWGYEDWHPFADRTAALNKAGVPQWVCPGTSSWLSVLGRVTNMIGNCRAAAGAGRTNGSSGYLTTDWGDMGHLQYLPVSEPGFAYAAAVSWCLDTNADLDLAAALDIHAFHDPAGELGAALLALGDVHRAIAPQFPNISVLVLHLYYPQLQVDRGVSAGMTSEDLRSVEESLAGAVDRLWRSRPERSDGDLVKDELRTAAALVALLCRDGQARLAEDGWLSSVPEATRSNLAAQLRPLIERHRDLWLARNRPGGLDDSVAWLQHLLECYETGVTDRSWGRI